MFNQYFKRFSIALYTVLAVISQPAVLHAQEVIRVQNGATLTVQNGAILTINGGITLANGSQLSNSGIITLLNNAIAGNADWIDATTTGYSHGNGSIVLGSTGSQTFGSPNSFGTITVQNAGLDLITDAHAGTWLLVRGNINTNTYKAVALSTATSAISRDAANPGYTKSWFVGTLRRYIAPASVNTYDFPIGIATGNNMATLDNLTAHPLTTTQYLDVSFGPKPGTDAGLILSEDGAPYTSVNDAGVWHITPDTEPTGGKYDLLLSVDGFSGLVDNLFTMLERLDASSDAADWIVPTGSNLPGSGTPGRTVAAGYARRNNLSAFSQFGIGMTTTPLPVTLTDFNARRIAKDFVALDWSTSLEQNDRGFDVQRRLDNDSTFGSVAFVPSLAPGGNSSEPLHYYFTDTNAYAGISYYRLRQVDLDNHFSYSAIKAVPGLAGSGITVSLYPNPGHGQFTLRVDGTDGSFGAIITDDRGQTIRSIRATGNSNVSVSGLQAGIYFIYLPDIFGQGRSFSEKVLIIR
jgi:hypothetical protein